MKIKKNVQITSDSIRLSMLGLPVIQTINDFSFLTHISQKTLYRLSSHSEKYYKIYTIPKKNGKFREISQPSKKLKGLQSWILVNILNKLTVSKCCKGFERKSSIADNARPHIGANTILTIDLKDFFPSIHRKYVYSIFKSVGYNQIISTILTNICTFKEGLPQGSPCSPKLANLATWRLDVRIQSYVGRRGITYTRYADDLTFSGLTSSKVSKLLPTIKTIIKEENFKINNDKTRITGFSRAKIVTGLVITDTTFGVGKDRYKLLRAKIYNLILEKEQKNFKLLNEVKGWLAFLNSVDKVRYKKALEYIEKLSIKYPASLVGKIF